MSSPSVLVRPLNLLALAAALIPTFVRADSVVVFNEIMYHPATNEAALEWIELHNQMSVDVDLSGWSLRGGIGFDFPEGTLVVGGGHLVVASNPEALRASTVLANVHGPFTGRLSNAGDSIELRSRNHRLMDRVAYGTEDDWPVGPDGSGHSLAKRDPQSSSAPSSNWITSLERGGSPGARNSAPDPAVSANSSVIFSEVAGEDSSFWIELHNPTRVPASLGGFVVQSRGAVDMEFAFSETQIIPARGAIVVSDQQLGFKPKRDDKLFLFTPDRRSVADATVIKKSTRARNLSNSMSWLAPSAPTPGEPNRFALHEEIVINEIMYHPPPVRASAAEYEDVVLLPIDATWRFDQSGADLGTAWSEPDFDDASWPRGKGLLYVETADLPGPKNTSLTLGRSTYYFRTEFNSAGTTDQLELSPLVDDGAVFYLNGIEVQRLNMPDGPITYSTPAVTGVTDAAFSGPLALPATSLLRGRNVLAVEVHQASVGSSDIVFGAELRVRRQLSPPLPYHESSESWLELFNRSGNPVPLDGWRLNGGIEFEFPNGTVVPAGGYLVIAQDAAAMRKSHPAIPLVGNFTKSLSRRTDRIDLEDQHGNPADQVTYYDSFPWPEHADGGGSSLELRDPRADNSRPEAWAGSDESQLSPWKTYSYRGAAAANLGPTRWREFVLGLLDAGEVLLDDISVIESPDTPQARECLQNGSFENGSAAWRLLGNHSRSRTIPDPENPSNPVLHLVATGPTEHMHNHAETTLANSIAVSNGREYQVSFRAKWITGSNQIHTRLYFNRLPRTTILEIPSSNGTPGRRNSRYEENIGPTFSDLKHTPTVPAANQPVTVSARVWHPDGVQACVLWWFIPNGSWNQTAMELSEDAIWTGTIPGKPAATLVQFYIEAADARGVVSTCPAGGPQSRALFRVNNGQANLARLHNLRILTLPADASSLHTGTNVMSNASTRSTLIYDEREVFYDTDLHLLGSERGRLDESRVGYTIRFPADHLFRGVHASISVDRSGGYSGNGGRQDEIVLRHAMNHAGGLPEMHNDLCRVIFPRPLEGRAAGNGMLVMAKHDDVFLDSAFPHGSDGTLFKLELIYYPTTSAGGNPQNPKLPQPDDVLGTDIRDLGSDKEVYRWNFMIENNRRRDDYEPLIQLAKAFSLTGAALDARSREVMDVDQWTRAFALKSLSGDVDTYGFGLPHNLLIYFRPDDSKALVFPWDLDFSWTRAANSPLAAGDNVARIINLPANRRLFYGHLLDIVTTTFNSGYMSRWTTHYASLAGQDYRGILNYITQRGNFARGQMPAELPFRVVSPAGPDLLTSNRTVTIQGDAWINVKEIRLINAAATAPPSMRWPTWTRWQTDTSLMLGENKIELHGFDFQGKPAGSTQLSITSTAVGGGLDTDADGLPDAWEKHYGLAAFQADSQQDPDGDGRTNFDEYLSGTNPKDNRSVLRLNTIRLAGESVQLSVTAAPGRSYALQSRDRLDSGIWQTVVVAAPELKEHPLEWSVPQPLRERFYRILTPNPQ